MKKNGEFQLRIGIFLLNPKSCCCKSQLENDDDSSATFPCSFIYVIALCAIPWCHHIFQHNKHALKLPNDINIPKRIYFPENFLWVLVCFFWGIVSWGCSAILENIREDRPTAISYWSHYGPPIRTIRQPWLINK